MDPLVVALRKCGEEQRAKVSNELILLEVGEIITNARGDRDEVGRAFVGMIKAGRTPSGQDSLMFWAQVVSYAADQEDAPTMRTALDRLDEFAAENKRLADWIERQRADLADIEKGGG